jgi:hypothetical protein
MIDELLKRFMYTFAPDTTVKPETYVTLDLPQALTAIYEIGLECIGAAEKPDVQLGDNTYMYSGEATGRNQLKADQRKAWAKACGVAE